jgi:hypothetical protein
MIRIQSLNIRTRLRRPLRHYARATSIAPRFIRQLPREDRGAIQIPRYNGFNVGLVLGLNFGVGVPGGFRGAVEGVVGGHAAVVAPVVDEVYDEFYAVRGGGGDDVVEALKPVGTRIYLGLLTFDERLVPDSGCGLRYVVEACDCVSGCLRVRGKTYPRLGGLSGQRTSDVTLRYRRRHWRLGIQSSSCLFQRSTRLSHRY